MVMINIPGKFRRITGFVISRLQERYQVWFVRYTQRAFNIPSGHPILVKCTVFLQTIFISLIRHIKPGLALFTKLKIHWYMYISLIIHILNMSLHHYQQKSNTNHKTSVKVELKGQKKNSPSNPFYYGFFLVLILYNLKEPSRIFISSKFIISVMKSIPKLIKIEFCVIMLKSPDFCVKVSLWSYVLCILRVWIFIS